VLNCAGNIRREKGQESAKADQQAPGGKTDKEREKEMELEEQNQETIILMKAIRDMNMPKFVAEDVPLFNALFNDLFPNMDVPETQNEVLREEIEVQMKLMKL
jgi:dynein heavy chain